MSPHDTVSAPDKAPSPMKASEQDIAVFVKEEGIHAKGYGTVPKCVMLDRDLSITAKAIYGYYVTMAGSGGSTYVGYKRILADLGISKNTYYAHSKQLLDHGYVKREQVSNGTKFGPITITLVSIPPKHQQAIQDYTRNPVYGLEYCNNMRCLGFGVLPRIPMADERLPIKSKALYAYYCAFAGTTRNAYPSREVILYHLNIGRDAFLKAHKALVDCNYITQVFQHIDGRQTHSRVILNDHPDANTTNKVMLFLSAGDRAELRPYHTGTDDCLHDDLTSTEAFTTVEEATAAKIQCPENWETEKHTKKPQVVKVLKNGKRYAMRQNGQPPENWETGKPAIRRRKVNPLKIGKRKFVASRTGQPPEKEEPENEEPEICETTINNPITNSLSNINPSKDGRNKDLKMMDGIDKKQIRKKVMEQIGYEALVHDMQSGILRDQREDLKLILNTLLWIYTTGKKTIRVAGEEMAAETVRKRCGQLDLTHIQYVLDCHYKNSRTIKSPVAYFATALYQAPMTMDAYYEAQTRADDQAGENAAHGVPLPRYYFVKEANAYA